MSIYLLNILSFTSEIFIYKNLKIGYHVKKKQPSINKQNMMIIISFFTLIHHSWMGFLYFILVSSNIYLSTYAYLYVKFAPLKNQILTLPLVDG